MAFFNKKEDVIDIELTQYGKYLLSKGKFKPEYYAFSDDEVIYDASYSEQGKSEYKKEAYDRIVKETPSTKAFYTHEGIETRILQLNGHVIDSSFESKRANRSGKINKIPVDEIYGKDFSDEFHMEPTSDALMRSKLGTSKMGEERAPAWRVKSLNNQTFALPIQASASADPSMVGHPVPQLNVDIDYNTYSYDMLFEPDPEVFETIVETSNNIVFSDKKQLFINHQNVFLDILEDNVNFDEINYDIEVYMIDEEEQEEVGSNGEVIRTTRENKRLLCFAPVGLENSDNPNYIETYFDIRSDDQITPREVIDASKETSAHPLFVSSVPGASGMTPLNQRPGNVMYGMEDERDEDICE